MSRQEESRQDHAPEEERLVAGSCLAMATDGTKGNAKRECLVEGRRRDPTPALLSDMAGLSDGTFYERTDFTSLPNENTY